MPSISAAFVLFPPDFAKADSINFFSTSSRTIPSGGISNRFEEGFTLQNSAGKSFAVIVDSAIKLPENVKAKKVIQIPILKTANEVIGKSIVANIVAVGAITEITGVVSREAVENAVLSRVPRGTEELNKKALEEGYKLALNI